MRKAALNTFIVEDSAVIRDNLIATLEELTPVQVVGTADTEEAAVQWLTGRPEGWRLVIIDIFLKRGSGLGVLTAIRLERLSQNVVVLSNYATPAMRKACIELGADRVFDKSRELEELIDYCAALDPR